MPWARRVFGVVAVTAAAVVVWAGMGLGALATGDFKAKLDEAMTKLAAYDFGLPNTALQTVRELIAGSSGNPAQRRELAARLAALLGSPAPRGAKDFVCRQLAIIGTGEDVPALASLLADEQLSHMARFALERIPGPAADSALREALGRVKGKLLVGVINSIGNRADAKAVEDLSRLTADPDPAVAVAAAAALGKIGPASSNALAQALAKAPAAVRPIVADAWLLCADQLVAQGKHNEAIAVYDRVRQTDVGRAARIAATRGAIVARQAGGAGLLVCLLYTSPSPRDS